MINDAMAPMGFGKRLWGVLVNPAATFQDIAERPSFWGILLLQMAVNGILGWMISPKVWEFSLLTMEKTGQELPAELLSTTHVATVITTTVGSMLAVPIMALIIAGLLKLYGQFTLGAGSFKGLFSATAWAQLPGSLGGIIVSGLILLAPAKDMTRVTTSLALFLPGSSTTSFLYQLMTKIEFFTIWSILLIALGGGYVMKQSPKKVGGFLLVVWIIYALGSAALGAYLGSKSPMG